MNPFFIIFQNMEDNNNENQPQKEDYTLNDLKNIIISNSIKKTEENAKSNYGIYIGVFFAFFISYFSGNGVGWMLLHSLCGWFYVVYKFAELFFKQG